ncbi:UNVERIFIED_CONTAM: hypothetical protein K2H54_056757 [Gekko kuhli]
MDGDTEKEEAPETENRGAAARTEIPMMTPEMRRAFSDNQGNPESQGSLQTKHRNPSEEETEERGRLSDSHAPDLAQKKFSQASKQMNSEEDTGWTTVTSNKKRQQKGTVTRGIYQVHGKQTTNRFELLAEDPSEEKEKEEERGSAAGKKTPMTMEEMTIEQLDVELTQTRKTIEDIKMKRIMMGDDANEYMVEPPKDMEEPRRGQCYHLHQKENYFKNKLRLLMCEQDMKREILQKSREVEMEREETTVNVTGNPEEKDESGENPIEGPQEVMEITVSEDQSNCSDLPLNQEGLLQEHHQEYSPPFKLEEKLDEGTPHPPTPITCEATPPETREGVDTMHLDVTQQPVQISPVVVGEPADRF